MDDEQQRIRAALGEREALLWSGRPDPRVIFTGADAYLIPFSLFFCAFTVFIFAGPGYAKGGPFVLVFGVLFGIASLYYLAGRYIYKAVQKRQTAYALTDERAIVIIGARRVVSVVLSTHSADVSRSRNGEHISVRFGQEGSGSGRRPNLYGNTGLDLLNRSNEQVAFFDVADPTGLESALARSAR